MEKLVATEPVAAAPDPPHHLRFIAHTDLAHLDPSVQLAGQVLDELAKVDSPLGSEEKDRFCPVKEISDPYELHLESELLDSLHTEI